MSTELPVVEKILSANDLVAADNRRLLDKHGVVAVNVMASPGAGKTSLILRSIEALRGRLRVGVIEGDVAGHVDADKVAEAGTPVPALCREHGMSSATFYKWRAKYGGMDASLMARLKELEDENRRLKKMYAEERLKAEVVQEALAKKW